MGRGHLSGVLVQGGVVVLGLGLQPEGKGAGGGHRVADIVAGKATRGDTVVTLKIGENVMTVTQGETTDQVEMDVAPYIVPETGPSRLRSSAWPSSFTYW